MTSRAEIVVLALEALGKVVAGEPVGSVEADLVDRRVPYAAAELNDRKVYYIDDIEDVADAPTMPFAEYVAAFCAPAFSVDSVRGLTVDQFRQQAEQRLRRLGQTETEEFIVKRDYF